MAKQSTMSAEIDVDAPIRAVYNQWTQFESFPHFLNAVKEVTQLDDTRTRWVVSVGGVRREFEAEITEQVPDEIIAWASTDGKTHTGSVRFGLAADGGTHVTLDMMWLPETFVEKVGAALDIDERQAAADLQRFKDFIEDRGRETGGWRGEIHDGVPERDAEAMAGGYATGATGSGMGTGIDYSTETPVGDQAVVDDLRSSDPSRTGAPYSEDDDRL